MEAEAKGEGAQSRPDRGEGAMRQPEAGSKIILGWLSLSAAA
jgi:hypothetical protein